MAHKETPRETRILVLSLVGFCAGATVLMLAYLVGFSLESSPAADADNAKAQQMAIPAVAALVIGVVTLAGRRRNWAMTLGLVGAAAAVVAILLTVLLPGGD